MSGGHVLYRSFTTQEQLDAEYDVDAGYSDFDALEATLVRAASEARSSPDARLGLPFGPTRDEHVDVYPAGGADGHRPVLVFIHGGYWRLGDASEFALAALGPVARGIDVVVTNYSLSPKATIEEITRQSRAAVAWVHANAADWGGDSGRVVVAGHSAGAQQAAMVLCTDWEGDYGLPADVVHAALLVSGVFDLRPLVHTSIAPSLQLSHRMITQQSPLLIPPPARQVPVTVAWGGGETAEFQRQSEDYASHLRDAGWRVTTEILGTDDHFGAMLGLEEEDSSLTRAVVDLSGS